MNDSSTMTQSFISWMNVMFQSSYFLQKVS